MPFSNLHPFPMAINSKRKEFAPQDADSFFDPIALRTAETQWSFGCFECNRGKSRHHLEGFQFPGKQTGRPKVVPHCKNDGKSWRCSYVSCVSNQCRPG